MKILDDMETDVLGSIGVSLINFRKLTELQKGNKISIERGCFGRISMRIINTFHQN